MEIDQKNGNTMWRDALALEMFNVGVAFEILEEGQSTPAGRKKASGHLILDVKMDFTRKARWVLDGHKTPDPIRSTFTGVVSRESVRIAFTYAALNGLQVFAADICNAYLQALLSKGLRHVWSRNRDRKHWKGGVNSSSNVWGQKCGLRH